MYGSAVTAIHTRAHEVTELSIDKWPSAGVEKLSRSPFYFHNTQTKSH